MHLALMLVPVLVVLYSRAVKKHEKSTLYLSLRRLKRRPRRSKRYILFVTFLVVKKPILPCKICIAYFQ